MGQAKHPGFNGTLWFSPSHAKQADSRDRFRTDCQIDLHQSANLFIAYVCRKSIGLKQRILLGYLQVASDHLGAHFLHSDFRLPA
jgi:hypothetical protein